MNNKSYMPIKEFAYLTGIKKENLRFYDKSGLLSPEIRGDNGYRYYTRRQLNSAYLISDLRELGVGLSEIKQYATYRTPEGMLELFARQEERIAAEIEHLHDMREIMVLRSINAKEALQHTNKEFLLSEVEEEPIFLCSPPPAEMDEDEKGIFSYEYAVQRGVNLSYPLGIIISEAPVEMHGFHSTQQYYFKTKRKHNDRKPSGRYAVAYGRCEILDIDSLYEELREFIHGKDLHIAGPVYVEWLLDELSVQEPNQFCVRIQVMVS